MRSISDKSGRENQNTHFMLNNFFPNIVPLICDNVRKLEPDKSHIIQHMGFA